MNKQNNLFIEDIIYEFILYYIYNYMKLSNLIKKLKNY